MKVVNQEESAVILGGGYPFGWYEEKCKTHGVIYKTFVHGYASYADAMEIGLTKWKEHSYLYNVKYGGAYKRCTGNTWTHF